MSQLLSVPPLDVRLLPLNTTVLLPELFRVSLPVGMLPSLMISAMSDICNAVAPAAAPAVTVLAVTLLSVPV